MGVGFIHWWLLLDVRPSITLATPHFLITEAQWAAQRRPGAPPLSQ